MAVQTLRSSAIRDLLAVTERPEVISLAGGLPAPELFPTAAIARATECELHDPASLQYSVTQGFGPLRAWIGAREGFPDDGVVVTHGSQQALDLLARVLVTPGRPAVLPDPAYVGAIQACTAAGAELVGIPVDAGGLRTDALETALAHGCRPAFVYVVPNFDNPSGATLSADRRGHLAVLAERYDFWVIADDPYGQLRWAGQAPDPIGGDRVIRLGSFSKILAPGLRVGWAAGPPEIISALVLLKQAADLHTSTLAQRVVLRVVSEPGWLAAHVDRLRACYAERASALVAALQSELGGRIRVALPEGGMFVWGHLEGVTPADDVLAAGLARGVAFVPGSAFAVGSDPHPAEMRLSFATSAPRELAEAARRLREAVDTAGRA